MMRIEVLLPILNEWWKNGQISNERAKTYKRTYFEELWGLINERQIVIVTGLRRVGKSTLLFQTIEKLLSEGTDPLNVLYFTFDQPSEEITQILNEYRKITNVDWKKDRVFVFLDEIQKQKDWSSELKLIYDNFPNVKFIISGSAGLNMEIDAIKDLAGRYFFLDVLPLYLKEFAEMYLERKIENPEIFREDMDLLMEKFTRRPFPEIVHWEDEAKVLEYIKSLVIEKAIYTDLPQFTRVFRPELAESLLNIFMSEVGLFLNIDRLSRDVGVSKAVLNEHIHYLEFARLIKVIQNFRPSVMARSRKLRRVYPYHISLTVPFKYNIEEGKAFEAQARTYLRLKNYWRKARREVDFLSISGDDIKPIEINSAKQLKPAMYRNLDDFMEIYGRSSAVLIYGGKENRVIEMNGGRLIYVVPLEKVLWDAGFSLPVTNR